MKLTERIIHREHQQTLDEMRELVTEVSASAGRLVSAMEHDELKR